MAFHNEIGKIGEDRAAELMRSKGYKVVERNWRLGHLEMDVICESKTEIIFVEVKTRSGMYGGQSPESFVDAEKQQHMVAAANAYIQYKGLTDKTIRFDIVGITMEKGEIVSVTHLEDAFHPRLRTVQGSSFSGMWRQHSRDAYAKLRKR